MVQRYPNAGNNAKTEKGILQSFLEPLFKATSSLQHTLQLLPANLTSTATPITSLTDFPVDVNEYIMEIQWTTNRMLKFCLRVKIFMRIGKLESYQLTETTNEYRIVVNHWKRDSIRWDIYERDEITHTPEYILCGLNSW